jgi:hypothetical protein
MGFQVFSDSHCDGTIFASGENLPAGLGVHFKEMPDGSEQK